MENEVLAKRLKEYRKKAGFTQQRLSDEIGIKRSAYAYYEIGKSAPKLDTLVKIANFYDLPVEAFLDEHKSSFELGESEPKFTPDWDIEDTFNQLSRFEQSVICKVRKMSPKEKNELFEYLSKY
ncbi:MAG: helix-turn-helix domain-containing protein [Eubacterium sp.]